MKVCIYSTVDVFYYSFYIEGLNRFYGQENVNFSITGFPPFAPRILAARITENGKEIRIVIDAMDTSDIYDHPLEWCDVYGKVNYNTDALPVNSRSKIRAIGPGFGIQIWSLKDTVKNAVTNFFKSKERVYDKKYFFTSYWRQYKRAPLAAYEEKSRVIPNYVYFISSLWKKEIQTNKSRAEFIEVCKRLDAIEFEGGFAPRSDGNTLGFAPLVSKRIPLKQYLKKISKSFVTFNTPAVQGCHGWKLAEFLIMGKAIISTDFTNALPIPLEHKKHVHIVSSTKEEIEKALEEILKSTEYRQNLERNAKQYFYHNLAPEVVIGKLTRHRENENFH